MIEGQSLDSIERFGSYDRESRNNKQNILAGMPDPSFQQSEHVAYDEGQIAKDPNFTTNAIFQSGLQVSASSSSAVSEVSEDEWEQASCVGSTASWGAIFYL
jgi:hypothetical protein